MLCTLTAAIVRPLSQSQFQSQSLSLSLSLSLCLDDEYILLVPGRGRVCFQADNRLWYAEEELSICIGRETKKKIRCAGRDYHKAKSARNGKNTKRVEEVRSMCHMVYYTILNYSYLKNNLSNFLQFKSITTFNFIFLLRDH